MVVDVRKILIIYWKTMKIKDCTFYREKNISESKVVDIILRYDIGSHFTLSETISFSDVCDDIVNIMAGECVVVSLPKDKLLERTIYCNELYKFFKDVLCLSIEKKEYIMKNHVACMSFRLKK